MCVDTAAESIAINILKLESATTFKVQIQRTFKNNYTDRNIIIETQK